MNVAAQSVHVKLTKDKDDMYILARSDGRHIVLSRYTEPEKDHQLLLQRLKLQLPAQSKPKITKEDVKKVA